MKLMHIVFGLVVLSMFVYLIYSYNPSILTLIFFILAIFGWIGFVFYKATRTN